MRASSEGSRKSRVIQPDDRLVKSRPLGVRRPRALPSRPLGRDQPSGPLADAERPEHSRPARLLLRLGSAAFFGLLPVAGLYGVFDAIADDRVTPDFSLTYYRAAEAVLAGDRIYPTGELIERGDYLIDYLYPPLTAFAVAPFTLLSAAAAELVFASFLVLAFAATLAVLGVRDWRCYGLAFLWPPVLDAIQTENVTIFLGLAAALAWRFRDRPRVAGATLGISFAIKVLLWPLALWLAATRRLSAASWSLLVAAALVITTWAIIGFEGLRDYPDLLRRSSEVQEDQSYTVYALALDLGASASVARALWLLLAGSVIALTVIAARRGDDRGTFVLAIAATIACSPIVWLHYFALLPSLLRLRRRDSLRCGFWVCPCTCSSRPECTTARRSRPRRCWARRH